MVQGSITLNGQDIMAASEKELEKIRGAQVSMIFQDPMTALNPVITVGDQIAEAILIHQKVSQDEANKKKLKRCLNWLVYQALA